MWYRGIHEKGSGDIVLAVCFTICTIYLSPCTQIADTTSSEPFSWVPLYVKIPSLVCESRLQWLNVFLVKALGSSVAPLFNGHTAAVIAVELVLKTELKNNKTTKLEYHQEFFSLLMNYKEGVLFFLFNIGSNKIVQRENNNILGDIFFLVVFLFCKSVPWRQKLRLNKAR